MALSTAARSWAGAIVITLLSTSFTARAANDAPRAPTRYNDATMVQLQAEINAGRLSTEELTRFYLAPIAALDQGPFGVNSVIELNPDALAIARHADALR